MFHDLDIKTSFSYGWGSPQEAAGILVQKGLKVISFADLYSVDQNLDVAFLPPDVRYVSGSEWYLKCTEGGVERVDLIFLDFDMTPELRVWVKREVTRVTYKWKTMPAELTREDSWKFKSTFGEKLADLNFRRSYFGTLPLLEQTIKAFKERGARFILSGIPFVSDFATKCKLIRYLKELGLMGIVVFKNSDMYVDAEREIQEGLDICKSAGLLPIVGSGIWRDYDSRLVDFEVASGAFDFLTRQIVEQMDADYCK